MSIFFGIEVQCVQDEIHDVHYQRTNAKNALDRHGEVPAHGGLCVQPGLLLLPPHLSGNASGEATFYIALFFLSAPASS